MAHFPQSHNKVRAPRVRVPSGEPIRFYLDGRCITAIAHQLSSTGGLAESMKRVVPGTLAEMKLETDSGQVCGLVEFLDVQKDGAKALLPFRFVAFDDDDHARLDMILSALRNRSASR